MEEASFQILIGGRFICTPRWGRDPIQDDFHRCYFVRTGEAWTTVGGEDVAMRAGRIYFIPGYQPIAQRCERRMTLTWLHFRAADLATETALTAQRRIMTWPASTWAFWKPVYRRLDELFAPAPPLRLRWQVQAMLRYMTAELVADQLDAARRANPSGLLERLRPAVAYMDNHFLDNPPLRDIARQVHLSPTYFHRCFSDLFHLSPHAYMLRRRMRLAQSLLEKGESSVSAAAHACGYPNVFYFSRSFKQFFGHTPRDVQRRLATPQP